MDKLDYEKVFNTLVKETGDYVTNNHLKCMVLGISGGIDSTVVAAICREVSKNTGIPLIGRSLPIKNKSDEFDVSKLVGEAFCDDFKVFTAMEPTYVRCLYEMMLAEGLIADEKSFVRDAIKDTSVQTPIANGNIQARLRMIYLYNLASIHKGLVMSTDNQTEYQLGFWTIHGDVGDFNPLQDLWKTEVYKLAEWISSYYFNKFKVSGFDQQFDEENAKRYEAVDRSIDLTPTDGLGISNSDLEQIGAKSYDEVDDILQTLLPIESYHKETLGIVRLIDYHYTCQEWLAAEGLLYSKYPKDVVDKVWNRHVASEFKRKKAPIYIPRNKYE